MLQTFVLAKQTSQDILYYQQIVLVQVVKQSVLFCILNISVSTLLSEDMELVHIKVKVLVMLVFTQLQFLYVYQRYGEDHKDKGLIDKSLAFPAKYH